MAAYDPERAFLDSLAADPNGGYSTNLQPIASDDDEDYDPSNLMPSTDYPAQQDQSSDAESASPVPSGARTATPPMTADAASMETSAAPAVNEPSQRRVGGFVVDSSDDEEVIPSAKPQVDGVALQNGASNTPQRSLSQTPNNTHPNPQVHIHSASQEQDGPAVLSLSVADIVPSATSVLPVTAAFALDSVKSPLVAPSPAPTATPVPQAAATSQPQARLPNDRVGILEDRITEDPRGDMDAWLSLINEHRKRNKFDEVRATYERFFKVFPSAAEEWVNYCTMELQNDDFYRVEQIFVKSIQSNPHLQLWSTYLDYVRRRNDLSSDPEGKARQVVNQAFDFVLSKVGIDKDAGPLWEEYIMFIKSGPGTLGGTGWQDQQKMDQLRKAYQRAICVPTNSVETIWKQYDQFEMAGPNKAVARKFLQEKSPSYVTARGAIYELKNNITKNLVRTTRPSLPPAPGFDGDVEYAQQVEIWKHWIAWEKDDPLVLKDEDLAAFHGRILYAYKQALMALRFWPEMWYDAAEFCFQNDLVTEGNEFLLEGTRANPESCLLAFKRADRIELTLEPEEGEEGIKRRGQAVREPYDKLLEALYELVVATKKREERTIARVKEMHAQNAPAEEPESNYEDEEDDGVRRAQAREAALETQIRAIEAGNNAQVQLLKKTISYTWIALMRAMRRVQGKGKPNGVIGGFRQIFADARKKGRILSDVYVASALIEHHCYQDPAATKIFERGMKLFPDDENFALEYLKHLINCNDVTNARAVFETTVNKLTQKPDTIPRAKPIFSFFHEWESKYGELSQITKLEKRMGDLFPEDPQLARFSHRYSSPTFDPTLVRPIISPATQSKPKGMPPMPMPVQLVSAPMQMQMPMAIPTIEDRPVQQDASHFDNGHNYNSPRPLPAVVHISNSPKRPYMPDESDSEQPRKVARGESPLKGAAGRRLDAARRNQARGMDGGSSHLNVTQNMPPPSLPREVMFLLSIIPGAQTYLETRFSAEKMVGLLQGIDMNPPASTQTPPPARPSPFPGPPPSMPHQQFQPPPFGMPSGMPRPGEYQQFNNTPVSHSQPGMANFWPAPGYPYASR